MTTTDTDALKERIARALYENAAYYGPEDVQPAWERRDDGERDEWREIAAAVLHIVAVEVRKAKAEALREAAREEFQFSPNVHYQAIRVHERLVNRAYRIETGDQ